MPRVTEVFAAIAQMTEAATIRTPLALQAGGAGQLVVTVTQGSPETRKEPASTHRLVDVAATVPSLLIAISR